jgi:hypothetical protein
MKLRTLSLAAVVSMAAVGPSQAGVFATEDFDGAATPLPTPLHNLSSGSGWLSPWIVQNNTTTDWAVLDTTPLAAPNISDNSDNYAVGGGSFLISGRRLPTGNGTLLGDSSFVSDKFSEAEIDNGVVYFSTLLRRDVDNTQDVYISLSDNAGGQQAINGASQYITIGDLGTGDLWDVEVKNTNLSPAPTTVLTPTTDAVTVGQADLFVLKLDLTNDLFTLYINPTSNDELTQVVDATGALGADFGFRTVHFKGGTGANVASIDRLIIADTFAEAAAIPEPASLALLAAGGLCLLKRRSR